MSESLVLGAAPNYLALEGAQVWTGAASTPIERLLDDDAGERFRWASPPSSRQTWTRWDFGRVRQLGALALPNHNLGQGAEVRLRLAVDQPLYGAQGVRVAATPITRWGGATGDPGGDVDAWSPFDPVATLAAVGDAWGGRFFSVPVLPPNEEPRVQAVRIRARPLPGDGPVYPLHVQMMRAPSGVDPLGQYPAGKWVGTIPRDPGGERLVDFPWTWGDVVESPSDELGVVVRLGALEGASTARGWEVRAIEWLYADSPNLAATHDSGWLSLDPGPVLDELRLVDLVDVPTDWGWIALDERGELAPIASRYGLLEIRPGLAPEGTAEVGLLAAGPALGLNLQTSVSVRAVDPSLVERSPVSGHQHVFPRRPYLAVRAALHQSAGTGARDVLGLLGLGMGRRRPMLVAPVPAAVSAPALRMWGRLAREVELDYRREIRSDRGAQDPDPWSWGSTVEFEQAL